MNQDPNPAAPPAAAAEACAGPAPAAAGLDARTRLLHAAIEHFALHGYAKTSTRELAEAAQVNVAAIRYYFGDKAGLYRAAYVEPLDPSADVARLVDPGLSLAEALAGFYAGFTEPLRQGDEARLCTKLHLREMLETTGLIGGGPEQVIRPLHDALRALLARHLGLPAPDAELERLTICLAGLGVHLHVGQDVNESLAPGINTAPGAIDAWQRTLVQAGLALVQAEAARRGVVLDLHRASVATPTPDTADVARPAIGPVPTPGDNAGPTP